MKRLVIAPNWIGDAVMSLPFLRALRRADPSGLLAVLARRGPATIYRAEGSADEVLGRASFARDALAARRGRFDEVWLLPNSYRAALLARASGARRRLGYATEKRGWLLTDALPPPPGTIHQLRDYDALLAAGGVAPDLEAPRLPLPEAARARAKAALEAVGLRERAFAALCPGSAFAQTKRWPAERFAALADALAGAGQPAAILVGPGEEELGARVAAAARSRPPVLGADLDPVELAAALALARVAVTNDSGPMHLCGAVGTPVVAFFGPTDPGRTGPSGSPSRVLDRYVFCSPCFKTECPYRHECLREIAVEDAMRAVEELRLSIPSFPDGGRGQG
ncbi:MAG TPA: lipopolysaccharide heptosyltransferase II [Thermoanaerobaculia bacterium]|nr:lipopolysaccharide heptosyltransferase II [Thermoanaerobaculia bacterium]